MFGLSRWFYDSCFFFCVGSSNERRQRGLTHTFSSFFPKLTNSSQAVQPAKTELIEAIKHVIDYAFDSYEEPEHQGFTEVTTDGTRIHHLDYELTDEAIAGVLKIHLKDATGIPSTDYGWKNVSDPYVVFSYGCTSVKSETIKDSVSPEWNSIHYLVIRKKHAKLIFDDKVHVTLFDDDSHEEKSIWNYFAKRFDKDDFLGTATIDLEELKDSDEHHYELQLQNKATPSTSPAVVRLSAKYISFEDACKELGVEKQSNKWSKKVEVIENSGPVCDRAWLRQFGRYKLHPIVFFESPSTDTQATLYMNKAAKMLLVSFRGTELAKYKDLLVDVSIDMSALKSTRQNNYALKETAALTHSGIRVHNGFLQAYESIREALLQVIYDLTQWSDAWNICVTGHSLGGALASLCAFEIVNRKNGTGMSPVVGVISYGAPRVGNRVFAHHYNETVLKTFRVIDRYDVVHLLPPFYTHTSRELLCLSTGEVYVEGELLEDLPPGALFDAGQVSTPRSADRWEGIYSEFGRRLNELVDRHLSPNYFAIVNAAFGRFFGHRDTETATEGAAE